MIREILLKMWWPFKKKEPEPVISAKFQAGDRVWFRHRGDRTTGHVYRVFAGENGEALYDVQVGGQCPYFLYGKKEEELNFQK